jgi:hypothetical protein
MYDRPDLNELIEAARLHLEATIVPAVRDDARLYFQSLVAINVLKIAERELALAPAHSEAEWAGLNTLEATAQAMPGTLPERQQAISDRNRRLCEAIRRGEYDDEAQKAALFVHLRATTSAALEVANPRFLKKLQQEDAGER